MCGGRHDSCSRKHKYARTSHGMGSESPSRGVDLFFAQEFCFFKQEHGPTSGSEQAKTDVLLTTVLGLLRSPRDPPPSHGRASSANKPPPTSTAAAAARAAAVTAAPPPHSHKQKNTPAPPGVHSIHAASDVLARRLQAPPVPVGKNTERTGHTGKALTSGTRPSLGRKETGRSVSPRTDFDAARLKPVDIDRRGSQCDLSYLPHPRQSAGGAPRPSRVLASYRKNPWSANTVTPSGCRPSRCRVWAAAAAAVSPSPPPPQTVFTAAAVGPPLPHTSAPGRRRGPAVAPVPVATAAAVGRRRRRRWRPAAERRAAVPRRRVVGGAHARPRRQRRRWGHGPQPAAAAAAVAATTRRSHGDGGRDGGGSRGRGGGGGASGALLSSQQRRSSSPGRQWRGRRVGGRLSGRGRRQRCRRVGAGGGGGVLDHAISRATGGADAGRAGRRAPRSVQVTWRRTDATVATAGTPTRARWVVGGAGRLVRAAADHAPAVLVAGGRAPTRARGGYVGRVRPPRW